MKYHHPVYIYCRSFGELITFIIFKSFKFLTPKTFFLYFQNKPLKQRRVVPIGIFFSKIPTISREMFLDLILYGKMHTRSTEVRRVRCNCSSWNEAISLNKNIPGFTSPSSRQTWTGKRNNLSKLNFHNKCLQTELVNEK